MKSPDMTKDPVPPAAIIFMILLYGSHVQSKLFVIAERTCDSPVAVISVDSTADALFQKELCSKTEMATLV